MNFQLFTTTLWLGIVFCQDYGLLHFKKDVKTLRECLEEHLNIFWYNDNSRLRSFLVNNFAREFSRSTVSRTSLISDVTSHIDCLTMRSLTLNNIGRPRDELEEDIVKALLNCSDVNTPENVNPSNRATSNDRLPLPFFANEPTEYYRLLNLILVNWPCIPESMCSTPVRLDELRSYAERGLAALESTDTGHCNQFMLYESWERRALLFFDGRNDSSLYPYIDHRHSMDNQVPYALGNIRMFTDRSLINIRERNPLASQEQVNRILQLHPVSNSESDRDGRYSLYDLRGMSSAEYYIEFHLSQFYRILFFYLELLDRDLINVSYEDVPQDVRSILYNDTFYHDYLIRRRNEELNLSETNNVHRRRLLRRNSVIEGDLVLLFWTRIRIQTKILALTTTTTSTTTEATFQNTTSEYDDLKKKKELRSRDYERECILKKLGAFIDEVKKETKNGKPGPSQSKKFIDYECMLEIKTSYMCNDEYSENMVNQLQFLIFLIDESFIFAKMLSSSLMYVVNE